MRFKYDPLNTAFKEVIGGVKENQKIKFKVATDAEKVDMIIFRDGCHENAYPMRKSRGGFFVFEKSFERGLYWYYFIADNVRFGRGDLYKAERGSVWSFQLTVCAERYTAPTVFKGGIIYQIFPDRFAKKGRFNVAEGKKKRNDWGGLPTYRDEDGNVYNNEFFGGNFKGIIDKLGYLKELNVTCVYLNPIGKAFSSHRYDTGDYLKCDEVLGTEKDLKNMLEEGKKLGISFVFDGVYNHTGADSRYFNRYDNYPNIGAYQSAASPYFDWFTFHRFPDVYDSWWGFENLPSIHKGCKKFQNFITETVIPHYMKMGFAGVRLDVVDELRGDFVKDIAKAVKKCNENGVVIGEVWEDATNKMAYGVRTEYFNGEELDSVMNYPLKDGIIGFMLTGDVAKLTRVFAEQLNNYPKPMLDNLMNVMSTHDTSRLLTVLGRKKVITDKDEMKFENLEGHDLERGKTLLKLAYAIAYTAYGVPSLYYGDEAGLWGDLDPYNRKCYPWGNEDKELIKFFKKLSSVRISHDVFFDGEFNLIYAENRVLIYERVKEDRKVVVAVSRYFTSVKLKFNEKLKEILCDSSAKKEFWLEPNSVMIFENIAKN